MKNGKRLLDKCYASLYTTNIIYDENTFTVYEKMLRITQVFFTCVKCFESAPPGLFIFSCRK